MLAALAADAAAFIVVIVIDGGGAGGTAVDVGAGAAVDDAWCPCLLLPLLSLVHFALALGCISSLPKRWVPSRWLPHEQTSSSYLACHDEPVIWHHGQGKHRHLIWQNKTCLCLASAFHAPSSIIPMPASGVDHAQTSTTWGDLIAH